MSAVSRNADGVSVPRVGFCRALLYHIQWDFWKEYLDGLGAEIVLSPPTSKEMLSDGLKLAVDDTCLPVKAFYGHAQWLTTEAVDFMLVPRLVSLEKHTYICPKFMGLPDMIRTAVAGPPPVIDPKIDIRQSALRQRASLMNAASDMGFSPRSAREAIQQAGSPYRRKMRTMSSRVKPALKCGHSSSKQSAMKMAVLGHPYLLADDVTSAGLMWALADMDVKPVTLESVDDEILQEYLQDLPKKVFWSEGGRLLAAARHFSRRDDIDGIIQVNAFGCGSDSLLGEEAQRRVRQEGSCPILSVSLDEHSGEAGLLTRLEAFCDMVKRKKQ